MLGDVCVIVLTVAHVWSDGIEHISIRKTRWTSVQAKFGEKMHIGSFFVYNSMSYPRLSLVYCRRKCYKIES